MESINTTYNCKIETLTPVFIGAGKDKDYIKGIDYVTGKGQVFILDKEQLLRTLINENLIDKYTELVSKAQSDKIIELLNKNKIRYEKVKLLSYETETEPVGEIKAFIRNGLGKPYIPGSSVKGAIRSVLFKYLYRKIQPKGFANNYEKELFGGINDNIFRFIRIYDAEFTNDDMQLCKVGLFNLTKSSGTWKSFQKKSGGFPLSIENLAFESISNFKFSIADNLGQFISEKSPQNLPRFYREIVSDNNPIQHIFKIVNSYTYEFCQKELNFFSKYNQMEGTDTIIEFYEDMMQECQTIDDGCILRMSFGSGFHGITGDWRIKDHTTTIENPDKENEVWNSFLRKRAPAHYKSRRIITDYENELLPLGFVKITLPSDAQKVGKIQII